MKGSQMDLSALFKSQWKQLRGKVKENWGKLTDDDLDTIEGQFEQLVGVIQEKYELTEAKAKAELNDFLSNLKI